MTKVDFVLEVPFETVLAEVVPTMKIHYAFNRTLHVAYLAFETTLFVINSFNALDVELLNVYLHFAS